MALRVQYCSGVMVEDQCYGAASPALQWRNGRGSVLFMVQRVQYCSSVMVEDQCYGAASTVLQWRNGRGSVLWSSESSTVVA